MGPPVVWFHSCLVWRTGCHCPETLIEDQFHLISLALLLRLPLRALSSAPACFCIFFPHPFSWDIELWGWQAKAMTVEMDDVKARRDTEQAWRPLRTIWIPQDLLCHWRVFSKVGRLIGLMFWASYLLMAHRALCCRELRNNLGSISVQLAGSHTRLSRSFCGVSSSGRLCQWQMTG